MISLLASTQRVVTDQPAERITDSGTADEDRTDRPHSASSELSKDQTFDILRNSRRRAVISCLRTRGRELSVKEVSTYVAAEEYGVPAAELTPEQYKRVYTGLYQCHLGRMEELSVIDFDRKENTVRLRDVAAQLDPYFDDETGSGAAHIEIGVAVVVASVVALGSIGLGPIGSIPPILLAALTAVALLGLSLFQLLESETLTG